MSTSTGVVDREVAIAKSPSSFSKRVRRTIENNVCLDSEESLKVIDEELMRAVSSETLLRYNAIGLFRNNSGDEKTFKMSKPTRWMHYFVSHSWRTPAWLKIVCIAYELNVLRALVASLATHVLVHGVEIAGLWTFPIPSAESYIWDGAEVRRWRWQLNYVIACLVFFVVLRWGQVLPFNRRRLFVDKCCIHQTDAEKKLRGVHQLGAFLRQSEYLLILWQPEYFTRLWCIYELAAFSHINKKSCERVLIRPLKLLVMIIALCVFHTCASMCVTLVVSRTLFSYWHVNWLVSTTTDSAQQSLYYLLGWFVLALCGLYFVPSVLLWKFCQEHMRDRKLLLEQLAHFSLDAAQCEHAEDREFVKGRISEWFGGPQEFEDYVRGSLYRQVERLLQRQGPVPYSTVVVGSISHVFLSSTLVVHVWEDDEPRVLKSLILSTPMICFFTDAIAIQLVLKLAGSLFGEDVEGNSFFQRKLAGPLATALIFSIVNSLALANAGPAMPLWCTGIIFAAMLVATLWSFNCLPLDAIWGQKRRERAGVASEPKTPTSAIRGAPSEPASIDNVSCPGVPVEAVAADEHVPPPIEITIDVEEEEGPVSHQPSSAASPVRGILSRASGDVRR